MGHGCTKPNPSGITPLEDEVENSSVASKGSQYKRPDLQEKGNAGETLKHEDAADNDSLGKDTVESLRMRIDRLLKDQSERVAELNRQLNETALQNSELQERLEDQKAVIESLESQNLELHLKILESRHLCTNLCPSPCPEDCLE